MHRDLAPGRHLFRFGNRDCENTILADGRHLIRFNGRRERDDPFELPALEFFNEPVIRVVLFHIIVGLAFDCQTLAVDINGHIFFRHAGHMKLDNKGIFLFREVHFGRLR